MSDVAALYQMADKWEQKAEESITISADAAYRECAKTLRDHLDQ